MKTINLSDIKSELSSYENSYKEAAKKNNYASWNEFCKELLQAAKDNEGTIDDIIFQAEDSFKQLGVEKS